MISKCITVQPHSQHLTQNSHAHFLKKRGKKIRSLSHGDGVVCTVKLERQAIVDEDRVVCTVKLERQAIVDEGESVPFKTHASQI